MIMIPKICEGDEFGVIGIYIDDLYFSIESMAEWGEENVEIILNKYRDSLKKYGMTEQAINGSIYLLRQSIQTEARRNE